MGVQSGLFLFADSPAEPPENDREVEVNAGMAARSAMRWPLEHDREVEAETGDGSEIGDAVRGGATEVAARSGLLS